MVGGFRLADFGLAGLALASALAGQSPDVVVVRRAAAVTVDGQLAEWGASPSLVLDQREQVWSHSAESPWRGPDDLSARIWLANDAAHLYVAGVVRDDSLVPGEVGRQWHQGDAIELFLDLGRRREPAVADAFDADVVQLFFMPFSDERLWGRVDWSVDPPLPTGIALNGVRVVFERLSEQEYAFEAAIPFHNFPKIEGVRDVPFSIALDDHDENTDRYQYMTFDGRNPVDRPDHLGRLHFGEVVPLRSIPEPSHGGVAAWLVQLTPYLLLLLAGVSVIVVTTWGFGALNRRLPSFRALGRVVGVALFLLGILLPDWLVEGRERSARRELAGVVEDLHREIGRMESGVLGGVRGGERDRALIDLLAGKTIVRDQEFQYTFHAELVEGGAAVGVGSHPFASLGFKVRSYRIPLDSGQEQLFNFDEPLPPGLLNVVVARPQSPGGALLFGGAPPPRVLLSRYPVADAPAKTTEITFSRPFEPGAGAELERMELSVVTVDLGEPVRALSMSSLEQTTLVLVGLTWVSADETDETPLFLGVDSLGGVPTDLRGRWPQDAGFELSVGGSMSFQLPTDDVAADFDRLWVFYAGTYRGRPLDLGVGDRVAELRLDFDGTGQDSRIVAFDHQVTMFFEEDRYNLDLPENSVVQVAYRWTGDDGDTRLSLMRGLELPDGETLARLTIRNLGPYPIRFRSVVFGTGVERVETYPADSPLVRAGDAGQIALADDVRGRIGRARIAVYRDGRLSETTLAAADHPERISLPSDAQPASLNEVVYRQPRVDGGTRVYEAYTNLPGEGWSGALVGVFVSDVDHDAFVRWVHRIGIALCLLAVPVLLLLFNDVLAFLTSLRLRLVSLMTVATLIPLVVLSLVLIGVLESSHEDGVREDMRQAVAATDSRIAEQKQQLARTAQSWLGDLVERSADPALRERDNFGGALRAALEPMMLSQMPPAWKERGGYLLFEFHPEPGSAFAPASVFAGAIELENLDTPLRNEPGIYLVWGVPLIGVRREIVIEGFGTCSLSVARRMDEAFLSGVAPGRGLVLCDARGYPLATASASAATMAGLRDHAMRPSTFRERETLRERIVEVGQPVVARHLQDDREWIASYGVLRDLQETPRLLVGVVDEYRPATLPLTMGDVPVRSFFLAAAGLLLAFSVYLSFVVTSRISRPIDQLERGAQALRRGELDVHVPSEEGGQIGRLTRTFNQMAGDLRGRIRDLRILNRGILDLTSKLELGEALASTVGFYTRHSPADCVRILLVDQQREQVRVYGGGGGSVDPDARDVTEALTAAGAFCMKLHGKDRTDCALPRRFPAFRSVLVLPLLLAGRNRGAVLLLFESAVPNPVNLELLSTVAAQTSAAIENARLYQNAVEDFHTGALRREFFTTRVAREVGLAQARRHPLCLLGLRLVDGEAIARTLGAEQYGRYLAGLVDDVREVLTADTLICRAGETELWVLVTGGDRSAGERTLTELAAVPPRHDAALPSSCRGPKFATGLAVYPDDGASAEFLFDALQSALDAGAQQSPRARGRGALRPTGAAYLNSPAMEGVVRTLERVAPTDLTVFLEGETGTGKEVLTDLIHSWSKRASGPLVKVHCAALSESLLNSELFGHEKGAFTGAVERRIGRFEQAHGGTIFLDEIGEISHDLQVKLLRVLQEREIDRVGGARPIPVDVRVIAATNRDIEAMVREQRFREDLYYRLQGMMIRVPPLRERRQEIPGLVEHFRHEAVAAGHTTVRGFLPEAMDELFLRDWPGNIRELRNVVFRAMVLAFGDHVTRADLLGRSAPSADRPPAASDSGGTGPRSAAAGRAEAPGPPPGLGDEPVVEIPRPPAALDAPAGAAAGGGRRDPLSDRLRRLYELLVERGTLSSAEYGHAVGVSQRTALRDLRTLQSRGYIVRVGKRRGARYRPADSAVGG